MLLHSQLKPEQWVPRAPGDWPGISLRESQGIFMWLLAWAWVVFLTRDGLKVVELLTLQSGALEPSASKVERELSFMAWPQKSQSFSSLFSVDKYSHKNSPHLRGGDVDSSPQ